MADQTGEMEPGSAGGSPEPSAPLVGSPKPDAPGTSFAYRAGWVLGLAGAVMLIAGLAMLAAGDRSPGQLASAAAAIVGGLGALGLAVGVRRGRAWAASGAKLALVVIIVAGLAHTAIGIPNRSLWIPLDAIAAAWALIASDQARFRFRPLRVGGLALAGLLVIGELALPIGSLAADLAKPPPDPTQVIIVHNQSPRAVAVLVGSVLGPTTSQAVVAPCGGVERIQITSADYLDDGRLMAMIALDENGGIDNWFAMSPAPAETFDGTVTILPIWSRGDLAGQLPLELVVHPDFTVDSKLPTPAACVPDPSAGPTGS